MAATAAKPPPPSCEVSARRGESGGEEGSVGEPAAGGGGDDDGVGEVGDEGAGEGGGRLGGGCGGAMRVGAATVVMAVGGTLSAAARRIGAFDRAVTAWLASPESAEPSCTTVTDASRVVAPTVALTAEALTLRAAARLEVLMVGAPRDGAVEAGSTVCVATNEALSCRRRRLELASVTVQSSSAAASQMSSRSFSATCGIETPSGTVVCSALVSVRTTETVAVLWPTSSPPTALL